MIYKNNTWNPWTKKSVNTPFGTTEQAIGDGEHKLGVEFDAKPLGQNYSYDLEVNGERWEIKKLDGDNSFRLGVEVATFYNPINNNVLRIMEKILYLKEQLLDSDSGTVIKSCIKDIESLSGRSTTLLIDGLRKNEVSSSNLNKANILIENLKKILIKDGVIPLYSSINGLKKNYDILDAFKKIIVEDISIEDKIRLVGGNDIYNRLLVSSQISDDIIIFDNITLLDKLNLIIRSVFQITKLVLVHPTDGFMPISNMEKIYCNRITSGSPRCKLR